MEDGEMTVNWDGSEVVRNAREYETEVRMVAAKYPVGTKLAQTNGGPTGEIVAIQPDGCTLVVRTNGVARKARKTGLDVGWLSRLLPPSLYNEYAAKVGPLDDEYEAKRKPLYDEYWAKLKPLYDEYWAKRKPLDDEYLAKIKPFDDEYLAKLKPLNDEYWAKRKPLDDEYWAKLKLVDEGEDGMKHKPAKI